MNLKQILMGVFTVFLSFFSACKEVITNNEIVDSFGKNPINDKKKISWSEVKKSSLENVQIEFLPGELILGEIVKEHSSARLQSKITTIFTSEILVSTNLSYQGNAVRVSFKQTKRIPKHLKTKRDRKPHTDLAMKELRQKYREIKNPLSFNYITESSFDKLFKNTIVFKASKK